MNTAVPQMRAETADVLLDYQPAKTAAIHQGQRDQAVKGALEALREQYRALIREVQSPRMSEREQGQVDGLTGAIAFITCRLDESKEG